MLGLEGVDEDVCVCLCNLSEKVVESWCWIVVSFRISLCSKSQRAGLSERKRWRESNGLFRWDERQIARDRDSKISIA